MERKKWFICLLIVFLILPSIVVANEYVPSSLDKNLVDFYIKISKLIDTTHDSSLRANYHNTLNAVVNSNDTTEEKRQKFHTIYHEVSYSIIKQDTKVIQPTKPPVNQQPTITDKDRQNFSDYFAKLDRMVNSIVDENLKAAYKNRVKELQAIIFTLQKPYDALNAMYHEIERIINSQVSKPTITDKDRQNFSDYFAKLDRMINSIVDENLKAVYKNRVKELQAIIITLDKPYDALNATYHEIERIINSQVSKPTITDKDRQNFIDYFAKLDRMVNSIVDENLKSAYKNRVKELQAIIFTLDKPYDALNTMYHEIERIINSQVIKNSNDKGIIDKQDPKKDEKLNVEKDAKANDEVKVLLQRLEIISKRLEELERLTQLQKKELDELKSRPLENRIYLQGQTLEYDVKPMIVNGRTLVPVRTVSEGLGAIVDWESKTRTVIIKKDGKIIKLPIGSNVVDVDGKTVTLDVPATVVNGRTMVPLRFISEALGEQVLYNESTGDIDIGLGL